MSLREIVNKILDIAKKQPNIGYVGYGDVYKLNSIPNIDYSVFFVTEQNHTQEDNLITYNLTLFYIDRELNDGSNTLQIHSQGIKMLNNIINVFNNTSDADVEPTINYTTFVQRFQDNCCGVFANIKIIDDNEIGSCGY